MSAVGEGKQVDVTPEQNGGVLKEILVEGSGSELPPKGCKVIVHYVGKLIDGKQFDSSRDRGDPFEFTIGKGSVIKGWDIGVATMKKGEKSLLICRQDYAYGAVGSPPNIPPKATLIFEVELLNWEAEDLSGKSDKGILRQPIETGTGVDSPKDLANVEVTLVGTLPDGKEFFNQRLSFCLGEGIKHDVPRGVEKALRKMVMKEMSRIDLKPNYAWGSSGCTKLGVPPNSPVTYIVTLHNFEIIKDSWAMTSTEKLDRARILKEKGTNFFKDGNLNLAIKMYNKLTELVQFDGGYEGSEEEERAKLLLAGYLNLSMAYLKIENAVQCKDMCNKALEQDPRSVKALFRRGQAYLGMKEPLLAIKDFKAVLDIEPENKAAVSQIAICQQRAREIKENEKKIYANMFDKFARKDREWRFGWWDKDKPVVEESDLNSDEEIARERRLETERKKRFLEAKLKEKKEKEEKERLLKEQQGENGDQNAGKGDCNSGDGDKDAVNGDKDTGIVDQRSGDNEESKDNIKSLQKIKEISSNSELPKEEINNGRTVDQMQPTTSSGKVDSANVINKTADK